MEIFMKIINGNYFSKKASETFIWVPNTPLNIVLQKSYYNTMSLSCHEQVRLKWATFREIRPDDDPIVGEVLTLVTPGFFGLVNPRPRANSAPVS